MRAWIGSAWMVLTRSGFGAACSRADARELSSDAKSTTSSRSSRPRNPSSPRPAKLHLSPDGPHPELDDAATPPASGRRCPTSSSIRRQAYRTCGTFARLHAALITADARRHGGSAQHPAFRPAPASSRNTGSVTWATSRWTKSRTYVFAVKPKKARDPGNATFQGEVWVDDRDLQIVKPTAAASARTKEGKRRLSQVRNLPRTDRRQILVPHLHHRQFHAALQGKRRPSEGNRPLREL